MPSNNLETITGNLKEAYHLCVPGTLQHVDELTNERRINPQLSSLWVYTPDGMVYSVDNDIPTLRITREAANPVLNNINDSFTQLIRNHDYKVLPADFDKVKSAEDTVTIDLTKLTLHIDSVEWCYLVIPTTKPSEMNKSYDKLNEEDRKLAERVYGQGNDFVENMQMFNNAGISNTKIYVFNPMYVKFIAKEYAIGLVSWMTNFHGYFNFNDFGRHIINNINLRGVRQNSLPSNLSPPPSSPTPRDRQVVRDLNVALNPPSTKQSSQPNSTPITTTIPSLSIDQRIVSLYQTLPHFSDVDEQRIRASPHDIEIYERLVKQGCNLELD